MKIVTNSGRWQPIETAPKDVRPVLVSVDGVVGEAEYHPSYDVWGWAGWHPTDYHGDSIRPSHWMPLPEPPK